MPALPTAARSRPRFGSEAKNAVFTSGECAMTTMSSAAYGLTKSTLKAEFGISTLPYYSDVKGAPQNTIIGGASLWVTKGQSKEQLRAVWAFLKYLAQPKVAVAWHKGTGYFPAVNAAVADLLNEGWFSKDPNSLTAFLQILSGRRDTAAAAGVRLGPFVQIREFERTAIEKAVAGQLSPKAALDEAARKADQLLADFARLNP